MGKRLAKCLDKIMIKNVSSRVPFRSVYLSKRRHTSTCTCMQQLNARYTSTCTRTWLCTHGYVMHTQYMLYSNRNIELTTNDKAVLADGVRQTRQRAPLSRRDVIALDAAQYDFVVLAADGYDHLQETCSSSSRRQYEYMYSYTSTSYQHMHS